MSLKYEKNGENVVYLHNGLFTAGHKDEIIKQLVGKLMEQESIILSRELNAER